MIEYTAEVFDLHLRDTTKNPYFVFSSQEPDIGSFRATLEKNYPPDRYDVISIFVND